MGFKIFVHAIWLVIGHLADALRISALLYVVQFGILLMVGLLTVARLTPTGTVDPTALIYFLLSVVVVVVVANLWVAVAWHRYVLLDEMPRSFMPRFNGERIYAYFGRSLQMALVSVPVALVGTVLLAGIGGLFMAGKNTTPSSATTLLAFILIFVVYVPLSIVLYRLALVLPATAVGKPIRLGEAWSATSDASGSILVLAILSVLGVYVLDLPSQFLLASPWAWLALVWQVLVSWIEVIVGVSILTTLYGVYVERRPIG